MAASADLGGDREGDKSNWNVSKLIYSLKSTFLPEDFAQVQTILDAREQKLKQEIEQLKEDKASFIYKFEEERLEKMNFQTQLKKYQTEHEEMETKVSKLQGENAVLLTRAKSAEERCQRLVAEVRELGQKARELAEKESEMLALRLRNYELECEKDKLEDELTTSRKRFDDLDKRVLSLESDVPLLMNGDDSNVNGTQNGDSVTMGVKCENIVKAEDVSFGRSCDSPVKANGNSRDTGSARLPSQNIIEIGDSDDDSAPVDIPSEKGTTLLHPVDNGCSYQIGAENGSTTLERKRSLSYGGESENGENEGDTLTGKFKMRKLEEPVCKPDHFPLNRCSTTTISSDSDEVKRGFTTPKVDLMVSRQREQKIESEQQSRNHFNGFPLYGLGNFVEESSSSSESDSDDDNDGIPIFLNHSRLAPEIQKENGN